MRLGLGLSLSSLSSSPLLDPATLSLTGWWKASFSASPWVGTASAGSSGSHNISEATNPPAAGAAVDGLTPADFDGTNDRLASASDIGTFLGSGAWSVALLVFVDAIGADGSPDIIGESGGYWGIGTRPSNKVFLLQFDTGAKNVETAITTAAWHLVQVRFTGSAISIRVDNGAWATPVSAGNIGSTAAALRLGISYASQFYNGKMLEAMTASSSFSDATFDQIYAYMKHTYPSAGLP